MLPYVILHNAVSVDGRMDWITPDLEQFYGLAADFEEDATLAGCETMLKAYPPEQITESPKEIPPPEKRPDDKRPLLVIPDSRARLRCWHLLRKEPYWSGMVALCSRSTPVAYLDTLQKNRVDCIVVGGDHVDYRKALEELGANYNVKKIRVDSGGTLNGILLRQGLVDEVSVLIDPSLVGGTTPQSLFKGSDLTTRGGVIPLKLTHCEQVKNDVVWVKYTVIK